MDDIFTNIDPNTFQSMQSNILNSLFGMSSINQTQEESPTIPSQRVFEKEIFNSIHNLFGNSLSQAEERTHYEPELSKKMPTKEIIVDITLQDCYTCKPKEITIKRNIMGDIHEEIICIHIPKGITNKQEVIFVEKGDITKEYSIPGDLKIILHIKKDPYFKKYGQDIIFEKNILLSEALYGCLFDIILPNQKCLHFISRDIIQPRTTKFFAGVGFPNENGENGDLHILFKIDFPKTLLDKQKELLYKLLPKREKNKGNTIQYDEIYTI